jgi:hypothetical protein
MYTSVFAYTTGTASVSDFGNPARGPLAPPGTTLLYHTSTTWIRRNFPYVTSVSFDMFKSSSQGIHLFCKAATTEPEVPWVHPWINIKLHSRHVHCRVDALHAGVAPRPSEATP